VIGDRGKDGSGGSGRGSSGGGRGGGSRRGNGDSEPDESSWGSRRVQRPAGAPGGRRGPDRPRGQGGTWQPGSGLRGPGRGAAGTGSAATGTGRRRAASRGAAGGGAAGGGTAGSGAAGSGAAGRSGSAGRAGTAGRGTGPNGPGAGERARGPRAGTGRGPGGHGAAGLGPAGWRPGGPPRPGQRPGPPRGPRARAKWVLRRKNPKHRLNATALVIAVVLSLFAGRLVQMQGLNWTKYRTQAERQRTSDITIPTLRGSITTSDGTVLAMTEQTAQVLADPLQIAAAQRPLVAQALAGPLAMPAATLLNLLNHPTSPGNVVLKNSVSAAVARQVNALKLANFPSAGLPGIVTKTTYARSYPNGDLAANLVGFTSTNTANGDLTGEAGLESQYNSLLSGRDGSEEVETGINGVPIPLTQAAVKAPVPARSLRLTINSNIQYDAEQQCEAEVKLAKAKNCSAVVMSPHTGKILAIAQYPTYNPNHITNVANTGDIAATNIFAPGSTLKPITVAADLEKGGQNSLSTYVVPDRITVHGEQYQDAELHPTQKYTIAGILANSLNDGMVQIVQRITPQQQYDYLRSFGLGTTTGLGLAGESAGIVPRPGTPTYYGDEPEEMSFGQGIGVTALQMASVYATLGNGGVRVQPSIVAGTTSSSGKFTPAPAPKSRRVIKAKTDHELLTMMEQVPKVDASGGEPWGLIAGYPVASKTGTAQVSDGGKCALCQFGSSYIGIAPAQSPKLVVAINVQDPTANGYYGDEIAGPVFYKVMKFALQTLKIPPTNAKVPDIRLTKP
jgi:cell division protein FtsI (penicillin-binding protein 3)